MGGSHEAENSARNSCSRHTRAGHADARDSGTDNTAARSDATRTRDSSSSGNARSETGVTPRAYFAPGFFS